MLKITKSGLKEVGYNIDEEPKLGSVFGIGNGYFGIRGSLEELGECFIQGTYIRGVFDKIVEIPKVFSSNLYMKRFYFDQQKAKEFETEDSCINVVDPLTIRFEINGKVFLPWEGNLKKWVRYIDTKTGGLVRRVTWDDGEGNITEFEFKRFASFKDNHLILQEAKIKKVNHDLPVRILMGVDTLVKTNGQHKSIVKSVRNNKDSVKLNLYMGDRYNMYVALLSKNIVNSAEFIETLEDDGKYLSSYKMNGKETVVRKMVSMYSSVDKVDDYVSSCNVDKDYEVAYKEHLQEYRKAFNKVDIKVEGNDEIDALLRYANYQTLIGFDRYESVHSLSAKNLTGEIYNQFVWWDAEIFQLPFVIANFPEAAKHCLEYRYRLLEQSKKNAQLDGYKGAKYAFCSSVNGDENVWIYAKHPFLQIHISSDVAYGVYNYYRQTLDVDFLVNKGLPMMSEIMEYFYSRSTPRDGKLHLLNVTGTDEHHPYVNDNAYTNYQVQFLAGKTIELADKFGYSIDTNIRKDIEELRDNLFLPIPNEKGIIPQFEGYLSLKPYLPIAGKNAAGFQMKANGLYHLSQIIKQPDVLNLYTYLDINMNQEIYKNNWKYYYKMCEASSSLTYPVHTISAIDFHENDVFLENLHNSLEIDIKDIHNCAYQGVHAGCLAGGWYAFYRGVFGIRPQEDKVIINPKFDSPFKKVSMNFIYQGTNIKVTLTHKECCIESKAKKEIRFIYKGNTLIHDGLTVINK